MTDIHLSERSWWAVILSGFLYMALVAVPASHWIEVRSVHVNDAATPAELTLDVDRDIKMFFPGVYSVKIRRSPGGGFVCNTGTSLPIPYRPDAEMPDPLMLWWWLGTTGDLRACEENGLGRAGTYWWRHATRSCARSGAWCRKRPAAWIAIHSGLER